MQAAQSIRVTLSSEIAEEFERVRKAEKRSAAELVREAVRSYLSFLRHFPEIPPSRAELKAIQQGRRAYARGEHVRLEKVLHGLGPGHNQTRREKPPKNSR